MVSRKPSVDFQLFIVLSNNTSRCFVVRRRPGSGVSGSGVASGLFEIPVAIRVPMGGVHSLSSSRGSGVPECWICLWVVSVNRGVQLPVQSLTKNQLLNNGKLELLSTFSVVWGSCNLYKGRTSRIYFLSRKRSESSDWIDDLLVLKIAPHLVKVVSKVLGSVPVVVHWESIRQREVPTVAAVEVNRQLSSRRHCYGSVQFVHVIQHLTWHCLPSEQWAVGTMPAHFILNLKFEMRA